MSYAAGIIGAGGIAGFGILGMHDESDLGQKRFRASHAGGYDEAREIDVVAVADVDEEKLAQFRDAWNIPERGLYSDHSAMLAEEDLDVVSVCTPSLLHHDHVVDAARSDADPAVIWCEKPIASSVGEASEMIEVCEATDTELVVNHSFRFTEKLQALKSLITEENILGEIESVATQYRMELLRNSTHVLDTLVYLLDARPRQVSGYVTGDNEAVDTLNADANVTDSGGGGHVIMDDDTFVTVDCTIPRDVSSMSFQFIGTEGKLYLNNDDGEWRYWSLEDGTHVERPLPIEGNWTWDEDYENSFANAAGHVVDLLHGSATNHSPGRQAKRSLEVIVGFYLSHHTGGRVTFPLDPSLQDCSVTSW